MIPACSTPGTAWTRCSQPTGATEDSLRRFLTATLMVLVVLLVGLGVLAVDGVNATLFDRFLPYLYPPRNELRLLSGLLGGLALAPRPRIGSVIEAIREFYA